MNEPEPNERATRTLKLAETLLAATKAMEDSDWLACHRLCAESARQSRVLALLEREQEKP